MKPGESNTIEPKAINFPVNSDQSLSLSSGLLTSSLKRKDVVCSATDRTTAIVTSRDFGLRAEEIWDGLMFYEQIKKLPGILLRLMLPVPVRTEGRKSEVGDEVKCIYESGYLVKRVTKVVPGREYVFDVIDQRLAFGGGVKLLGGRYGLAETAEGITRVSLETRYVGRNRPRWLCQPAESWACHAFHRFILDSIYRSIKNKNPRMNHDL